MAGKNGINFCETGKGKRVLISIKECLHPTLGCIEYSITRTVNPHLLIVMLMSGAAQPTLLIYTGTRKRSILLQGARIQSSLPEFRVP